MALSLTGQSPANTYNTLVITDGLFVYNGTGSRLRSANITSSHCISASYIPTSVTASYWDSSSINTWVGNNYQLKIATGSTLPVTSSQAISSSWARITDVGNNNIDYNVVFSGEGHGNNIVTNGGGTSLYAFNPSTGSFKATVFLGTLTGSVNGTASVAITASYALNAGSGVGLATGSTYPITSSQAISSSWAKITDVGNSNIDYNVVFSGEGYGNSIVTNGGGTSLYAFNPSTGSFKATVFLGTLTGNVNGTASVAVSSSYWNSSSINSWTTNIFQSKIATGSTLPITASQAVTASYWNSSSVNSWVGNNYQLKIATGSTLPVTSSQAVTASYLNPTPQVIVGTDPIDRIVIANQTIKFTEIVSLHTQSINITPDDGWLQFVQDGTAIMTLSPLTNNVTIGNLPAPVDSTAKLFVMGAISASVVSASLIGTASYATTASYALNGGGGLATGSTYPITASWSVSSSMAVSSSYSSITILQQLNTTQSMWSTQSLFAVSASWASSSISASYWDSSSVNSWTTNNFQFKIATGSTLPITASQSVTASYWNSSSVNSWTTNNFQFKIATGSTLPITASYWDSSSVNSWTTNNFQFKIATGSTYPITSSQSVTASYWDSSSVNSWTTNNFQFKIATGSTLPITSSQSVTASYWDSSSVNSWVGNNYQSKIATGSTLPITASQSVTASYWDSSSINSWVGNNYQSKIATGSTLPITASYWDSSSVNSWVGNNYQFKIATGSTLPITSSQSVTASYWNSSSVNSWVGNNYQSKIATGSTLPITASYWDSSSVNSWVGNNYQSKIATGSTLPITASYWDSSSVNSWTVNNFQFKIATGSTLPVTASWATTASYALNGGGGGGLATGSTYPITSSQSVTASYALAGGSGGVSNGGSYNISSSWASSSLSSSYASTFTQFTQSITTSSYADFAPVLFNNVRIINGDLIIKSSYTGNWFKLDVYDDGAGGFTTELSGTTATGSITNSSSMYTAMFTTTSLSSSWASSSLSSSYALTASYALRTEYIQLIYPHVFSDSASVYTGSTTSSLYGHGVFNSSSNSSSNYVEYYLTVPYNLNSARELRGQIKYQLIGKDTGSYVHKLSMASIGDGNLLSTTPINEITFTTPTTGSAGTVKSTGWSTLTNWSGSLVAGQEWKIRLARDGSDSSVSQSADLSVNIEYQTL